MISDFISTQPIENNYIFQDILGYGEYTEVRKAIFRDDFSQYAIEIIDKKRITQQNLRAFLKQCEIMFKLEHPNIIEIYQIYDNEDFFYIVMEYMEGGELCNPKNQYRYQDENQIVQIVKAITDALDYCHQQKIVHRDIKPENIFWSKNNEQAVLKIAGFGFDRVIRYSNMTRFCGTPLFFAPQILQGKPYDQSVDYWSLGVITHILLSGRLPFQAQDQLQLYPMIINDKIQFPLLQWKYISSLGKDFTAKLLQKNPKKRYGAQNIWQHPWVNSDHTVDLHYNERKLILQQYQVSHKLQKIKLMIQGTLPDLQLSGEDD